jgi:hypothetical protein
MERRIPDDLPFSAAALGWLERVLQTPAGNPVNLWFNAVYTADAVESMNYQLRKVTKNRPSFSTGVAVFMILHPAVRNASEKRTSRLGVGAGFKPGEPLGLEMNGFRSYYILSFTHF